MWLKFLKCILEGIILTKLQLVDKLLEVGLCLRYFSKVLTKNQQPTFWNSLLLIASFQTEVFIWLVSMKFCTRTINKKEVYKSGIASLLPTSFWGLGSAQHQLQTRICNLSMESSPQEDGGQLYWDLMEDIKFSPTSWGAEPNEVVKMYHTYGGTKAKFCLSLFPYPK